MIDAHVIAEATSGGLSSADLLAASITLFVFIVVPLIIWAIRSLINEAKRRTTDSINLASMAKSNNEINDKLDQYMDHNNGQIVKIKEDIASVKTAIGMTRNGRNSGS